MPKKLIDGFQTFLNEYYTENHSSDMMRHLVAEGQDPEYFIVSCIDSRSHAGIIFQTPPGTFFSHKSMGAIVRPYRTGTALAAALQFALNYNNVKTLIILGHTGCGAVKALIDDINDPEIASFIAVAHEGLTHAHAEGESRPLQRRAEEYILRLSRRNIESYPSVKEAISEGRLTIKAWLFDMNAGDLLEFNDESETFVSLFNRSRHDRQDTEKGTVI